MFLVGKTPTDGLAPGAGWESGIALGLLALALASCWRSAGARGGLDSGVDVDGPGALAGSGGSGPGGGAGGRDGAGGGGNSGDGGLEGTAGTGGGVGGVGGTGGGGDPPANISGRWALFTFEDPVGVALSEAADGTLGGYGCATGAPGSTNAAGSVRLLGCGEISGKVTGQAAAFGFYSKEFGFGYSVQVTISADARRMAGALTTTSAAVEYPIAWLRLPDDDVWLQTVSAPNDPLAGNYDLTLIADASIGDGFLPGRSYLLTYWAGALSGHLGSFWTSEMSEPSQGTPLRAGPVVPTAPELPTSVALDFDGTGFIRVTARTTSGGLYVFSAARRMP